MFRPVILRSSCRKTDAALRSSAAGNSGEVRGARLIGMIWDFIGSVPVSEGLEGGRQGMKAGNLGEKKYRNGDDEEKERKGNIKSPMVFSHNLNRTSLISFSCLHA